MANFLKKKAIRGALLALALPLLFGTGPASAVVPVPASLGDTVWQDLNKNGVQDTGEPGVAGVTVKLYACGGTDPLQTTTTNTSGMYQFTGLAPGDYSVQFEAPTGYAFTAQNQGTNDAADSDANPASGTTECTTLVGGENDLTWDAGLYQPAASLGDRVWLDTNKDGVQDAGESGVAGVTVNLYNCAGEIQQTVVTNADGLYRFTELAAGDYFVQFVPPAGYVFTAANAGSDDTLDSDADASGKTVCTDLAAGETDLSWDAGLYLPAASLGDRVWLDANRDGVQDGSESGILGVTVNLTDCNGNILKSATTDATGNYLFTDLEPGKSYAVQFVAPTGYVFTAQNTGSDDAADSDADASGKTVCTDLAAGETDLTWDAGLYLPAASLGDRVWIDANKNGVQDAGESGFGGVVVKLIDCSTKVVLKTTTTAANGYYLFTDLVPGSYAVQFEAPTGYVLTTQYSGGDDTLDSDADPTTGTTACTDLIAGENDMTWDAGLYLPGASLGDRVWLDTDRDGFQDAGEPGLEGVTVKLTDCSGNVLYSTTTGANGLYQFTDLAPGSYAVQFEKPAGYTFSSSTAGPASDPLDSDADPTTGGTDCTTLAAGENDPTWDAGLYQPAECDLVLEKTCEVESPPPGPFTCSDAKPIDSLSMRWNGAQTVTIKAWKGAVGSTLLATINDITPGTEVTVSGYAGAPNDVYWEIFDNTTGTKIGHSIFHLSCSDIDMNGPEDCGKTAGDSKGVSGASNEWIFEGMAGNGQVLDCTPAQASPSSQCVTQLGPVPDCTTAGKPTSLTFRYSGGGCALSSNPQGGKAVCTATPTGGIVDGDVTVRAAGKSSLTSDVYGVNPATLPEAHEFTITFNGKELKADSYVELVAANGVRELNKLHTSCSQPLRVGDRFGSLELVAFNGQTAGNDVVYTYTLTNNGDSLKDVTLTDDKLGDVAAESTLGNETKTYALSVGLAETVTNVAIATGTLADGQQCSATAQATVTVEVPQVPFVCAEAKPINELSMVWNGAQAVRIKAWKGAVGSTLLADKDSITPGTEVTVSGFAGSPNDVYWEIFKAGTTEKIGTSVFHLSCSDADMNGAEDCGQYEGDSKGKVGFVNEWLFAGMAGNGKTLDCSTVTPPPPPDINVTEAAVPTVDKNKFYWRLTNSGPDAAVLTKVEVQAWPALQGKLKKVKLDGDTAADPADILWSASGAVISVFTSDVKHKQIVAGQTRTFTLEFEKDYLLDTTADYRVIITFAGGETLSWNLTP